MSAVDKALLTQTIGILSRKQNISQNFMNFSQFVCIIGWNMASFRL